MSTALADAEAELSAAEADVTRLRAENASLADDFRSDPTEDKKEGLRRAAQSLHAARDRVEAARARLDLAKRTGSPYGVITEGGRVMGTIAVTIPPGVSRSEREKLIDEALAGALEGAAREMGLVLSASPSRYARERPGRDESGATVMDVAGRAEGDVLVPGMARSGRAN
ncbi:MAG: hypothetical protein R3B70_10415 [Polyangiaceae bacterium]